MKVLYQTFYDWVIIREARIVMRSLRLRRTKIFSKLGIYFIFAKKSFSKFDPRTATGMAL